MDEENVEGEISSLSSRLRRHFVVKNILVGRIDPGGSSKNTNVMVRRIKTQGGKI